MEKKGLVPALKWFLLFYGIIVLRNVLESYLEKPHNLMTLNNLFFNYHLWFGSLFLSLALLVGVFSKQKPLKVLKGVIVFSPIILLVPVVDFIESTGQGYALRYLVGNGEFLLKNYFGFAGFMQGNATLGQLTVGFLALTAALFYVYENTKKLSRVVVCGFLFYSIVFFYASIPSYFLLLGFKKAFALGFLPGLLLVLCFGQLYFVFNQKKKHFLRGNRNIND